MRKKIMTKEDGDTFCGKKANKKKTVLPHWYLLMGKEQFFQWS